jgi:putative addiction module component (TIGR02574 family)
MSVTPLPQEIRSLSVADRVRLAEQIWNSVVEDEAQFSLSEQQKIELRRRVDAHRADPGRGKPWDHVKTDLLGG